ncbi:hypothetical protein [Shimia sp. Alg240-R146]|uniref:hypothetical protein n=1 Tax=Shimia sp. Alg240-R146 TaxID=2993449 RepID=UPI0022E0BC9A|nr:hypothetical protein [Shimia sp. Alg240-R146]
MCEPNLDYDPIQATVFQALTLASSAHNALDQLSEYWADRHGANAARKLSAQIAQEKIFSARDLDALEQVLHPLMSVAEGGPRSDAHTPSQHADGGHLKQILRPGAQDLHNKIQPLMELRSALLTLGRLRRSEQIAQTLRGEDMT